MLRSKGLHYLPHEILWNLGLTISRIFSHSNMNTFNFCSILYPRWCWIEKIRIWTIIILLKQIRRKIKEIQIEGFFFSKISKMVGLFRALTPLPSNEPNQIFYESFLVHGSSTQMKIFKSYVVKFCDRMPPKLLHNNT